jgi:hypothetical protein
MTPDLILCSSHTKKHKSECSDSSDDHRFHIGDGVQVLTSIPEKYFHVEYSTDNNTHHYGWPQKAGTAQVNATLEGVRHLPGILYPTPRISVNATMLIYNPVSLHPPAVALPWDPTVQPKYVRVFSRKF